MFGPEHSANGNQILTQRTHRWHEMGEWCKCMHSINYSICNYRVIIVAHSFFLYFSHNFFYIRNALLCSMTMTIKWNAVIASRSLKKFQRSKERRHFEIDAHCIRKTWHANFKLAIYMRSGISCATRTKFTNPPVVLFSCTILHLSVI